MSAFGIAGLIMAAALIVGGIVWWSYQAGKKRREALERLANEMRWSFSPEKDDTLLSSLGDLHLFSQGHSKRINNVLRGTTPHGSAVIFDYHFTIGAGKHQRTDHQTVLSLSLSGRTIPSFALRPEQVWHKMGARLGYQDIDFDRHPEFSKRYLLRGEDEQAIRHLFTDRMIMFFEGESGLCVEGGGGSLILYRQRKRIKPEQIRAFLQKGLQVAALMQR